MRSEAVVVHQLWQGVGQPTGTDVVDRLDRVVHAERGACVDHLLQSPLHFRVSSLHRGEIQFCRALSTGDRRQGSSTQTDQHALATQDDDGGTWGDLEVLFQGQLWPDGTHTSGQHDRFVVASDLLVATAVGDLGGQRTEVAVDTRSSELVVERSGPDWRLDHDVQRRGNVVGLANVQFPRLSGVREQQVRHCEPTQAGLWLRTTAHGTFVSDLTSRTGGCAREGRHGRWVVMCFHLDQGVHELLLGAPFLSLQVRGEVVTLVAFVDGCIVAVSTHRVLAVLQLGVSDHLEQRVLFLLAVDGPVGIEDLVSAMFRVHLRKHEQLNVRWVSADGVLESVDQVLDLTFVKSQPHLFVGLDQVLIGAQQVHSDQRFRLVVLKQVVVSWQRLVVQSLRHSVVDGTQTLESFLLQILHHRETWSHVDQDGQTSLDSLDMGTQSTHFHDVGGLGRPWRYCSRSWKDSQNVLVVVQLLHVIAGQFDQLVQFLVLLIGQVQWLIVLQQFGQFGQRFLILVEIPIMKIYIMDITRLDGDDDIGIY